MRKCRCRCRRYAQPFHSKAGINEPPPRNDVGTAAVAATTNATFTCFPNLPPELRYMIWDCYTADYEASLQPNNWSVRFRHNPEFSLSALTAAVTAASAKDEHEAAPAPPAAPLDSVTAVLESALNLPNQSKVPVTLLPIIPFVEGGPNAASTTGEARCKHHSPLLSVSREARTRLLHTRPHLFVPIGNRHQHQDQGNNASSSSSSSSPGDSEGGSESASTPTATPVSASTPASAAGASGSLAAINLLHDSVRLDHAQVRRLLHWRKAYIPREVYQDAPTYCDLTAVLPKNRRKKGRRAMYYPSVAEKALYFDVISRLVAPFRILNVVVAAVGYLQWVTKEPFVQPTAIWGDVELVELVGTGEDGAEGQGVLKEVQVVVETSKSRVHLVGCPWVRVRRNMSMISGEWLDMVKRSAEDRDQAAKWAWVLGAPGVDGHKAKSGDGRPYLQRSESWNDNDPPSKIPVGMQSRVCTCWGGFDRDSRVSLLRELWGTQDPQLSELYRASPPLG